LTVADPQRPFDAPSPRLACSARQGQTVVRNHSGNIKAKVEASFIDKSGRKMIRFSFLFAALGLGTSLAHAAGFQFIEIPGDGSLQPLKEAVWYSTKYRV
jgi:hypothetical protein